MKKIFVLVFFYLLFNKCFANITLPAVINNNMVLQQNDSVKLWGWADVSEKILITTSWNNRTDSVIANPSANWQLKIKTPGAGGPFTITFKAQNTIVLNNVMIGEVWVCSGQSNMQMSYSWGMPKMKPDFDSCYNSNIRLFQVPVTSSEHPQDNCRGEWVVCDTSALRTFSTAAYYFGKKLNKDLNIPIGLINTSWGATSAEVWTPAEIVNNDPVMKEEASTRRPNPWCPVKPGVVYNGMLYPLINYAVKGVIWYQGEGNTDHPNSYSKAFTTMIATWRNMWNKQLPFYYVQIAPFTYGNNFKGALLREQQAKVMSLDGTGMIVTTDLVDDTTDIHPKNKKDVGVRLANWALAKTYNRSGIAYASPMYKSMTMEKGKAIISFDYNSSGFMQTDKKITELYVAGDDKIFYPADAKIDGDHLIVWNKHVKNPMAVRYAFGNAAIGNLFSKDGLPVAPFRTDDWQIDQ